MTYNYTKSSNKIINNSKKIGGRIDQIWVSPSSEGRRVERPGMLRASSVSSTKSQAIALARGISKNNNLELIIQNKDGRISQKDSFGSDFFPPKG